VEHDDEDVARHWARFHRNLWRADSVEHGSAARAQARKPKSEVFAKSRSLGNRGLGPAHDGGRIPSSSRIHGAHSGVRNASLFNGSFVMALAPNAAISFEDGSPTVDAETLAQGLGIRAIDVQPLMRSGEITSRCEVGQDEDAGLTRLTFFLRGSRFRIVFGAAGRVVWRSTIDFGQRGLPASLRR
jgi:Family of unknown function (DUF6522)